MKEYSEPLSRLFTRILDIRIHTYVSVCIHITSRERASEPVLEGLYSVKHSRSPLHAKCICVYAR